MPTPEDYDRLASVGKTSGAYHLYSGLRQGWLTRSGTYSSSLDDAQSFTRDEALAMARRHKNQGGYQLLPVRKEDLA